MNQPITPSASDSTPPTASISSPTAGAAVTDTVTMTANAADNVGVAGVQFYVDGVAAGPEDRTAPYTYLWDTHLGANGSHTLTARARDLAGNATTSTPVTVTVANTGVFQDETLGTALSLPTSFAFLPDGRMLVGQMGGKVLIVPPPYTQPDPTPLLTITNIPNVSTTSDIEGLMNVAVDPNFATNHYFYVDYTASNPFRTRLSRFTANAAVNGTVAGSELILYQDTVNAGIDHHAGAIMFGNDGKLYFTTGDEFATPDTSQQLASPRGKIHRINKDGTIPLDNPFYDGNGPNVDSIWALGLRNPFRGFYDPPTGRLFVGDVGGNVYSTATEHLDLGAPGANYGWPDCESNCPAPYTNGVYNYSHNGRDAAIVAGFVYRGTQFPSSYEGSVFVADYAQNWIKRLTVDGSGNVTNVFNFSPPDGTPDSPNGSSITDLLEGPDGALYYLDIGFDDTSDSVTSPKIRRIRYVQTNQPPVAAAAASPSSGPPPLAVAFSSVGSSDPDGQPLSYSWDFGDGGTSTAANPSHTYTTAGRYTVRLTVSDGTTPTISAPLTVTVGTPPAPTILSPQDGATFRGGDVISYSGSGTDAEDGTVPPSAFTWEFDLLHAGHVHPGLPVSGSTGGTFTIPTTGHDFSGNVRYRLTLTVTDSSGISTSTSVTIWPQKVNLTFHTVPEGLTLYVNGLPSVTPFVHDELIGFNDTVEARDQAQGGTSYTYRSWSDGGARSHTIVTPTADVSYTATYDAATPSPIAAYGFNEGSGSTLTDLSGHGLNGAVNGATWTGFGKYGSALQFNGTSDYVDLENGSPLNYVDLASASPWSLTGSATWSAWVFATGTPADDGQIIAKSGSAGAAGWQLKTSPDTGPHTFAIGVSPDGVSNVQRYSTTVRQLNTWYHVAGVYDASTQSLHIYVNGVLDDGVLRGTVPAAQFSPSVNTNIGRRTGGFYFAGRIDELRVYNTALTQAQIQADMNTPITAGPDTLAPSAPTGLTATASSPTRIDLAWSAASDNVAVSGYRVERCQGATCTNFTEIAQPVSTGYGDTGLAAGTTYHYQVRAVDAAGNLGPYSATVTQTTPVPDTQAPSAPASLTATPGANRIDLSWPASTDNVGVTGYRVERCQGATCTTFTEIARSSGTSFSDTGLAASTTFRYQVRATDAAGNLGSYSPIASATTPTASAALVASYGFNAGSGTTLTDSSGHGLNGTINGAAWTTLGKYGGALLFNGTSNYVDLGNAPAWALTGSATWSAWVYATGTPADDGVIVGRSGDKSAKVAGWQLKTSPDTGPQTFAVAISPDGKSSIQRYSKTVRQLNTWYHVAGVYDAATKSLHIYVNGVLDDGTLRGTVPAAQFSPSTLNANIGRRSAGGFFFQGRIDELRVYKTPLTQAQIQADMSTAVG
jgi:glucose/arabinose dehydrogenase/PKD repeat protein